MIEAKAWEVFDDPMEEDLSLVIIRVLKTEGKKLKEVPPENMGMIALPSEQEGRGFKYMLKKYWGTEK